MPAVKLKLQRLKCPFCSTISTRGTGLSAHVRAQHAREYGKWNRNPNRLIEAAEAALPQHEAKRRPRPLAPVRSSAPVEFQQVAVQQQPKLVSAPPGQTGESDSREALSLLQKAHQQLSTRKQTIEGELARIETLRSEHEAITAQVVALDEAIKAFKRQL